MSQHQFPDTLWSAVIRGADPSESTRRAALERLFTRYWRPVFASLRYGWNLPPEAAEDAVQGFFLDLIERDALTGLDPERGRFRSFLKASLKHYMLKARRDAGRLKRGGGAAVVALEGIEEVIAAAGDPESIFEAEWARTVVGRALAELEQELTDGGRELRWQVFSGHDLADEPPTYASLAADLGISEGDVRNHLHRARKALRAHVVRQVADYAVDTEDAAREVRHLLG